MALAHRKLVAAYVTLAGLLSLHTTSSVAALQRRNVVPQPVQDGCMWRLHSMPLPAHNRMYMPSFVWRAPRNPHNPVALLPRHAPSCRMECL